MHAFRTARTRRRRRGRIRAQIRAQIRGQIRRRIRAAPGEAGTTPVRPPRVARPAARATRLPRAALLPLACLPVLAVVAGAVLWATADEDGTRGRAHQTVRPPIVPRARWLGDAERSQSPARYDDRVLAVFVHHTNSPNDYDCAQTPRTLRRMYAEQTGRRDWNDIGYNFLVDRCGTIYEGRAGGVDRPVTGAHTQGFNHRTAGIAAIGTFTADLPVPRAMTDAIAALTAWKLSLADVDPRGGVRLVSSNDHSRYPAGTSVLLPALAGHSDGYVTSCPGAALGRRLPALRETAARLQGRSQRSLHRPSADVSQSPPRSAA
ncbi:peptidoglycan recognition protein family protein [Streptomyces acidicola]|uniref:peptidoglycan recognition protein family protein n=1 Tax=Streptomyces acidicola TaxID=2596892 RepID=UPI00341BD5CB